MVPAFPMLWQARARRDAMMISVGVQVLLAAVLMAVAITFSVESFQEDFSLAVDGITQPLTRSFAVLLTAASSIGLSISSIRQWLRTPVSESAKIVDDAASGAIRQRLGFMHIIKKELDRLGKVLQGEHPVPNFLDYLLPTALLNGNTHSLLLWLFGLSQHGQDFQPCRMVIYVDDLDRCPTAKVMEVLQSLVLLTEGTPFIILLAIDQRIVVTAIENSGEGLYTDAGVNGHEYLDKIVQIPFVIPQLADDEKAKLCKGYLTPWRPQRPQSRVPRYRGEIQFGSRIRGLTTCLTSLCSFWSRRSRSSSSPLPISTHGPTPPRSRSAPSTVQPGGFSRAGWARRCAACCGRRATPTSCPTSGATCRSTTT